jgi:phospholipase C
MALIPQQPQQPTISVSPQVHPGIKHIFVLVLENRSFDHVFSQAIFRRQDPQWPTTMDGIDPETNLPTALTLLDPALVSPVPPAPGQPLTKLWPLDATQPTSFDPPHEYRHACLQKEALTPEQWIGALRNNPAVPPSTSDTVSPSISNSPDLWQSTSYLTISSTNSVLHFLAEEFAVCDQWFAGIPGPTWPNRYFLHAASANGLYDSPSSLLAFESLTVDGLDFPNGTVFSALSEKNVPWRIYWGSRFPQAFSLKHMTLWEWESNYRNFDDHFAQDLANNSVPEGYIFIEPNYGSALNGTFANGTSQHPPTPFSSGEELIANVYDAIRSSAVWESSVLIVTYDEHGGFFDHCRAGTVPPPGDGNAYADGCAALPANAGFPVCDFTKPGYRVPAIIISPFVKRGLIDHRAYEHASIPATILQQFGGKPLTARDANAKTIWDLLSTNLERIDNGANPAPACIPPSIRAAAQQANNNLNIATSTALSESDRCHAMVAIKFKKEVQTQQDLLSVQLMQTPEQLAHFANSIQTTLPTTLN